MAATVKCPLDGSTDVTKQTTTPGKEYSRVTWLCNSCGVTFATWQGADPWEKKGTT